MTLTDSGPLIALINRNDPYHRDCASAVGRLSSGPLLTTWPCFTESMHLLRRAGGYAAQAILWAMQRDGHLALHESSASELRRMDDLMEQYRDRPMDLGDSSLIAAAEVLGVNELFTLDSDFRFYRLKDGRVLNLTP